MPIPRIVSLALLAMAASSAAAASAGPGRRQAASWKNEIVYHLMVDRFFEAGQTGRHLAEMGGSSTFMGGNLAGVIEKLDYIQNLGATVILLNPVTDSGEYHGYSPLDLKSVNPHFGSIETYLTLIREAHKRKLKVMFDFVANHMSERSAVYREHPDWFRTPRGARAVNDSLTEDWTELTFYANPDLIQEDERVYRYLLSAARFWVDAGVDGFRMDAVTLIRPEFWRRFNGDIKQYAGPNFFILGEIFAKSPTRLNPYVKFFDGIFDFRTYEALHRIVNAGHLTEELSSAVREDALLDNPKLLPFTILDNHDTPRFVSEAKSSGKKGEALLRLALSYLMTARGTPCILYGTEIGLENAPSLMDSLFDRSRAPMLFDRNEESETFLHLRRLIQLRKQFDFNSKDRVDMPFAELSGPENDSRRSIYVSYLVDLRGEKRLVVHNFSDKDQGRVSINLKYMRGCPRKGRIDDQLAAEAFDISDGYAEIPMGPYQSRIFTVK